MPDLRIDTDTAIARISDYLVRIVKRDRTEGVILGLSGGLDSSVLAALAVRALGADAVTVVFLFDRDSDPGSERKARMMAESLGLGLEVMDISEEMSGQGVYKPVFIKLLRLSSLVGRASSAAYRMICGETPFKSTLRVGGGEMLGPWYKRLAFDLTMRHVDEGFSRRHMFRRIILERIAKERNLSPIGAANLSECAVGWFVKGGIDDLPVQPMTGLFKTQVRQLAQALNLPRPVRSQLPSPDMAKGVTDEFGIGHDYSDVDIAIDAMDCGLSDGEIAELGVAEAECADIRDLMMLSEWKRASPHEAPPVSGRFGSDLRGDGRQKSESVARDV